MFYLYFVTWHLKKNSFEPSDRIIFDESSINYTDSHTDRQLECGDIPSSESSLILMKSEPLGETSSPESTCEMNTSPDDCIGCGHSIQVNIIQSIICISILFLLFNFYISCSRQERFYLSVVDKRWHIGCLRCCVCQQLLEGETTCFSRDGSIYCKSDYYRWDDRYKSRNYWKENIQNDLFIFWYQIQ